MIPQLALMPADTNPANPVMTPIANQARGSRLISRFEHEHSRRPQPVVHVANEPWYKVEDHTTKRDI